MDKDNKDNFVEQKVKRVETSDNKSDRLKEKLSIAFGFGVLPFSFVFLVIYALICTLVELQVLEICKICFKLFVGLCLLD